jgi:hypothetical protein
MSRGFPSQDTGPGMSEMFHDLQVEQEKEPRSTTSISGAMARRATQHVGCLTRMQIITGLSMRQRALVLMASSPFESGSTRSAQRPPKPFLFITLKEAQCEFKNWLSRQIADAVIKVNLARTAYEYTEASSELYTLRRVAEQANRS